MQQFCKASSIFKGDNIKNAAILRDSSIFEVDNIKNETILWDFLQTWKLFAELRASCHCVLRFFHFTCLKYCACHEKVMPGHTKCCTCHAKSSQQTWRSDAPRCKAPGPPNSSDEHVSCTAPATENAFSQIFFKCPTPCYKTFTLCLLLTRCTIPCACHAKRHLKVQKWSEHEVFLTFWPRNVLRAKTACTFSTSQLPKVVRTCSVLYILTSKCASRHNGVHFFDIATSKSAPKLRCFVHFDFEMCFAPQRRALFRHRNF